MNRLLMNTGPKNNTVIKWCDNSFYFSGTFSVANYTSSSSRLLGPDLLRFWEPSLRTLSASAVEYFRHGYYIYPLILSHQKNYIFTQMTPTFRISMNLFCSTKLYWNILCCYPPFRLLPNITNFPKEYIEDIDQDFTITRILRFPKPQSSSSSSALNWHTFFAR